ncbi:MAG: nickel-dependent lactate racemase [Oscillospiraceae bacterium]|nr:nickel-dependent lactate racemase [Oscillospiraceae bacterium]
MSGTFLLPYDRGTIELNIPEQNKVQVIQSKEWPSDVDVARLLRDALENPIGAPTLRSLSENAKKITIITNDNTRPMPSAITIPAIINSLYHPETHYDITILIATGLHREMTRDEMIEQYGEEVCRKYRVVNHVATDSSSLCSFGKLRSGEELFLNQIVAQSDLLITEGYIEPHFFAGFSGGRKSLYPGVASAANILSNHRPENIANQCARQANLDGNPVHEICSEAVQLAGLKFILNVALNQDKQIIAAFAGHPVEAHLVGCKFVEEHMSADIHKTDIAITSNNGYPLDRNLYQVVKGIDTAAKAARDGGVVIVAAGCVDKVEHVHFQNLLQSCSTPEELREKMSQGPSETDKWQVQVLAKTLVTHTVILVSDGIGPELANSMFLKHAYTMDEALETAFAITGRDASISVMPEGPVVIPRVREGSY